MRLSSKYLVLGDRMPDEFHVSNASPSPRGLASLQLAGTTLVTPQA